MNCMPQFNINLELWVGFLIIRKHCNNICFFNNLQFSTEKLRNFWKFVTFAYLRPPEPKSPLCPAISCPGAKPWTPDKFSQIRQWSFLQEEFPPNIESPWLAFLITAEENGIDEWSWTKGLCFQTHIFVDSNQFSLFFEAAWKIPWFLVKLVKSLYF